MRVCIIFKGDNYRDNPARGGIMDACDNYDNWRTTLFDPLTEDGHEYDIVFHTYRSPIFENVCKLYKPSQLFVYNRTTMNENTLNVFKYMDANKNKYDRFLILRFDFVYRHKVTDWPHWEKKGIFIVNKDVHWPTTKLYSDILFIVDDVNNFMKVVGDHMLQSLGFNDLGRDLLLKGIPFHLMYEEYYHIENHPLHAISKHEKMPVLGENFPFVIVHDVSQWN